MSAGHFEMFSFELSKLLFSQSTHIEARPESWDVAEIMH